MKVPVVLAVLIGTFTLACSTVTPAPAEPTPNIDATAAVEPTLDIDATVEARLAHERAVDATVESRLREEKAGQPAPVPAATNPPTSVATAIASPEPKDTRVRRTVTAVPTLKPTPTYTPRPTPTYTPRPTPTPNAYSYYEKGDEYRRYENWVLAIGEYTRAIGLDSQFRNAYFYRAYSYSELGQEQNVL